MVSKNKEKAKEDWLRKQEKLKKNIIDEETS